MNRKMNRIPFDIALRLRQESTLYKQGKEDVLWCIEQARKNAKDENEMGTCWFAEKWLEKQGEQKPDDKPASKEDCNILFKKMKEAGYEWDDEKKELKKIEQKPDFCHHEVDLSNCSEEYRKAYYDGWNNCNQQHEQLKAEQNPAWSEEDEINLKGIINEIEANKNDAPDYDLATYDRFLSWLKSLKPRWKPTEEQMQALFEAKLASINNREYFLGLLYEDLKKL